jgi:pimeloyl-ACP methyl ester carboxylesterase
VKLDYSKVHMLGHSFGASTSLKTALEDKRITGFVVAMDPCMYILHEEKDYETHKNGFSNKTLILLAEDYYETHYPSFENDYRVNIFR